MVNCRKCGRFIKRLKKAYCNNKCKGLHYRGKSLDRMTPSKTEYVRIRLEDGKREYLHRFNYVHHYNDVIFSDEVIHHKDENKRNAHPNNLIKTKKDEHTPHTHTKWKQPNFIDPEFGW